MMSVMIIFERDKPRYLIIWSVVFLFTQVLGYLLYAIAKTFTFKKRDSLKVKEVEDDIYTNLISSNLSNGQDDTTDDLFKFGELAFNSKTRLFNNYEIFDNYSNFLNDFLHIISSANNYVYIQVPKISKLFLQDISATLLELAEKDISIKVTYDSIFSTKSIKNLKNAGIRFYKFSKYPTVNRIYSNLRTIVSVDGKYAYIGDTNISSKHLSGKVDVANLFIKYKGEIVEDIDVSVRKDTIFASGKFIEYKNEKRDNITNKSMVQYVSNELNTDIELLIIKAICMAKKSIQLQLEEFIPTESITSLLRFAINSNIDVKLMVPLKTNGNGKYFASRAYAKELALLGANVYLYDGYIKFNAITIDSKYVLTGSFILDRVYINNSLQNLALICDNRIANTFNKMFDNAVKNSYRINDAKYMLLREKFFKNFV